MWRIDDPRVSHLELWDTLVEGATLFTHRDRDVYPALVAEVAAQAAAREGLTSVYLGGGDSRLAAAGEALRSLGLRTFVAHDPTFVAESGARSWVCDARTPLIVDAGQTSFKVSSAAGRRRVAREPDWQGERGFLTALRRVVDAAGAHDVAVVGLPCSIEGEVGLASSYFERLDLHALAAIFRAPLWIASDAELAARSALVAHPTEAALVITLGHGVGAAVVRP